MIEQVTNLDMGEGGGGELVRVVASVLSLRVGLVDQVLDLVVHVEGRHGSSCGCLYWCGGKALDVILSRGKGCERPMERKR